MLPALSPRLTCHGGLALGPADRSARPAESQQHGRLGGLPPPSGLLGADHRVSEQSGRSQAAGGVCTRPLRGKVRLDGGFSSLRLRPEQTNHDNYHDLVWWSLLVYTMLLLNPKAVQRNQGLFRLSEAWLYEVFIHSQCTEDRGRRGVLV